MNKKILVFLTILLTSGAFAQTPCDPPIYTEAECATAGGWWDSINMYCMDCSGGSGSTAPSYISFTYPYTGMVWEAGNNYTISWSSDATEGYTVDIKLYYNGSYETTIATGAWIDNNSQYYSWTVPDDITARTDYQIEICVSGSSCYYSDMFTINNSGTGGGDDDDGSIELLTNATEYGVDGNQQGYPINAWYHDVKHQSLYLASDLSNAGILSGSVITGIKFKVNQTPGRDLDSLRIAYNWTSNTEISSFDTTTTVVHGPTNYIMSEFLPNNWIQFDFTTPITWDGVNNLII